MNLAAYDTVKHKTDKSGTWIDSKRHILLSREIVNRKYYTFVKKFDPKTNVTIYFIVLLDYKPNDKITFKTRKDDYGRLKFNVESIFYESGLYKLEDRVNVDITRVEHNDDGDIYQINV